jgi:hypothetical protein
MTTGRPDLPRFLSTYDDFMAHVEEQFVDLKPHARGRRFVSFALEFIPQIEEAAGFSGLELSEKQSHDDGIDLLTAQTESGRRLFVQSKFKIRTKDELDTILSKFEAFEADTIGQSGQGALFAEPLLLQPVFMIITASKLEGIINAYTSSRLSSRPFWDKLRDERRLYIVDGPRILQRLQVLYAKSFLLPPEVTIQSKAGWLIDGPVFLGTISGQQLVSLYERHGDGLFFENIRDFLGTGTSSSRDTVNSKIIETIVEAPSKMLERNNGITMRARSVRQLDDATILIDGAAIVNGCQTTMCLVHCKDDIDEELYVPVKVVTTEDAWQVARAANYQNVVRQIDLDLARYLRPQLLQKAAVDQGYGSGSVSTNISGLMSTLTETRINYDETKYLYLGLFSNTPSQLFEDNYTNLKSGVLEYLYEQAKGEDDIFTALFALVREAREAQLLCDQAYSGSDYAPMFKRLLDPDKPKYNAYLAILALAGALKQNLADKAPSVTDEGKRMIQLLDDTTLLLSTDKRRFQESYLFAYQVLAEVALESMSDEAGDIRVAQQMFKRVKDAAFNALYHKLRMRLDADAKLHHREEEEQSSR